MATDNLGLAGSGRFIAALGVLVVAAGAALAVLRYVGGAPPERGPEGLLGSIALGAVVAVPGILALVALAGRPALLLPAATVLLPLSFLSFAGAALPLLLPAVMLFVAYGRRSTGQAAGRGQAALCAAAVLALLVAAVVALFAYDDPRNWSTPTGGGSTSDVITAVESLGSLAFSTAAIAAGWLLTQPTVRTRPDRDTDESAPPRR